MISCEKPVRNKLSLSIFLEELRRQLTGGLLDMRARPYSPARFRPIVLLVEQPQRKAVGKKGQ